MMPTLTLAFTQANPYYYGSIPAARPGAQEVVPFPDPRVGGVLAGIIGKAFFWRRIR